MRRAKPVSQLAALLVKEAAMVEACLLKLALADYGTEQSTIANERRPTQGL